MASSISSIDELSQQARPTPTFLGIPPEIQAVIYDNVSDQDEHLEWMGANTSSSELCMPFPKIRIHSLDQVCKQTRQQYLDTYLRQTYFRIPVAIPDLGIRRETGLAVELTTQRWLEYLETRRLSFRRVQYRLSRREEFANVTITYIPRIRSYRVEFKHDDGWRMAEPLGLFGYNCLEICARKLLKKFMELCLHSEVELLGLNTLKILEHALYEPNFDLNLVNNSVGEPWSVDVPLSKSVSASAL